MNAPQDTRIKTALITGASAGIGKSFCHVYARAGYDLVLVARREDRLNELADALRKEHGVMTYVLARDLADPAAPAGICDWLEGQGIEIDALVNNAGYALSHTVMTTPLEDIKGFMQVLMTAPVELCHRLAPGMQDRGEGQIINVASIAAWMPPIRGDVYCAAKSFLLNFSLGLGLELKSFGVNVTALCPGFTFSEFHDVMGTRKSVSKLPRFLWMDADSVAQQGYEAVCEGKDVHTPGLVNQGASQIAAMLPTQVRQFLAKRQNIMDY